MALIEQKRLILKDSKVDWIAYDTEFVDPLNDGITIYRKVDGSYFTDGGYTTFNLDCFDDACRGFEMPSWREDGTVKKICNRYGCEITGDKEELRALHDSQLIQAIIAIYTWMSLRGSDDEQ